MKPKTNPDSNPRPLYEAENESRFWSPDTIRIQKRISILISGHYTKPKMNLDFDLRVLGEAKMNCDLASRRLSEAKNELRFGSPDT